jgi:hypothetical protein
VCTINCVALTLPRKKQTEAAQYARCGLRDAQTDQLNKARRQQRKPTVVQIHSTTSSKSGSGTTTNDAADSHIQCFHGCLLNNLVQVHASGLSWLLELSYPAD